MRLMRGQVAVKQVERKYSTDTGLEDPTGVQEEIYTVLQVGKYDRIIYTFFERWVWYHLFPLWKVGSKVQIDKSGALRAQDGVLIVAQHKIVRIYD